MINKQSLKLIRTKFFKKNAFLFDLDGTLYLGKNLIPGSLRLIHKLTEEKKNILYFTNNSSRSADDYVKKLKKLGFPVTPSQVLMSTHTLIHYLKKKKKSRVYLLGTPAMEKMLKGWKIKMTNSNPQAIVVGFDKTLNYQKLLEACRWIEKGIPWIVTHPDVYCPTDEGLEPDCGAIAALIASATRTTPEIVLGKPHPSMIEEAHRRLRISKKEMILIGDRLSTDIEMAKQAKIDAILVLSGETKAKDLKNLVKKPSINIVSSVKDLLG